MAWNECDASGYYSVCFRLGKKRFKRSLKTKDKEEADDLTKSIERTIRDVERGRFVVPNDADLVAFLLSDGRVVERPAVPDQVTIKGLFDRYFNDIPEGSLEDSTIYGMKLHQRHLQKHLKAAFAIRSLTRDHLQGYIRRRSKAKGRNGKISAATIRKEIVTLRTVWNWASGKYVDGKFPNKRLKYPKTIEKPPFMSFVEVEERTKGLKEKEATELWECVYLTVEDIELLLNHVEKTSSPLVYTLLTFSAHTGARRAEIMRARVTDIDLKNGWVTIHERKRVHGKKTTRRVPISPRLHEALRQWLSKHPGGTDLFCRTGYVARSKKRSPTTGHLGKNRGTTLAMRVATVKERPMVAIAPLTKNEMRDQFKRALEGTPWSKLQGWHVFRHSFISALAAQGVDQRIIDDFVGHQSDEQRLRYRHLSPSVTKQAITSVFG